MAETSRALFARSWEVSRPRQWTGRGSPSLGSSSSRYPELVMPAGVLPQEADREGIQPPLAARPRDPTPGVIGEVNRRRRAVGQGGRRAVAQKEAELLAPVQGREPPAPGEVAQGLIVLDMRGTKGREVAGVRRSELSPEARGHLEGRRYAPILKTRHRSLNAYSDPRRFGSAAMPHARIATGRWHGAAARWRNDLVPILSRFRS